jgi:prepilin-type N-terminal cleavage/methylation domain-containing protein
VSHNTLLFIIIILFYYYSMTYKKGFTLIELLVVIAIIGILSSVVLASLNSAREKGNQGAVQSNLKTIQVQAELYYDNNSQLYGASDFNASLAGCTTASTMYSDDTTISRAIQSAVDAGAAGSQDCGIGSSGQEWVVSVEFKDNTGFWCVDSTGFSGTSSVAASGTSCP